MKTKKTNTTNNIDVLHRRLRSANQKLKRAAADASTNVDKLEEVRHLALFFFAAGSPSQQKMAEEFLTLFQED